MQLVIEAYRFSQGLDLHTRSLIGESLVHAALELPRRTADLLAQERASYSPHEVARVFEALRDLEALIARAEALGLAASPLRAALPEAEQELSALSPKTPRNGSS
jgi:hypothetical protein